MKRATLTVDKDLAFHSGEDRHPQVIARTFCHAHKVDVITAEQINGVWTFEVETDADHLPLFPPYIIARPHK